ncbi:hypothetical protein [Nocardia lasii]|uniref:Mce-associated membrane protein n=1 Tax=Nocardia lasii TaxID=1616107 RepID=A0ABW1JKA7_9NOCA
MTDQIPSPPVPSVWAQPTPTAPVDVPAPQPGFGYPAPASQQPNPGYAPYSTMPVPPRRPRRWIWPVVAAVTAVVAVAGWITAGTLLLEEEPPVPPHPSIARDEARAAAQVAACDLTTAMTNYTHTDLGGYKSGVDRLMTGTLRENFDSGWSALELAMIQAQVTSRVENLDCLYKSGDGDRMIVVAVFSQVRTSVTAPTPAPTMMIVHNSLVLSEGRWLVEKLDSPFVK